jgi:nicotinamide mononucleotide transporter
VLYALLEAAGPLLAPAFVLAGSPVTWLELLAVVLALAMVAANFRVHAAAWPLAIGSSLLYALLFADTRLYGQAALQGLFIAVALWGWWQWLHGRTADGQPLRVRRLPLRAAKLLAAGTMAAWLLLGWALARGTDSPAPYLDALPTAGAIAGQWLLARKYLENWAVWLGVNVFSVALFWHQALWFTAGLYALFALLSVLGWRAWRARL